MSKWPLDFAPSHSPLFLKQLGNLLGTPFGLANDFTLANKFVKFPTSEIRDAVYEFWVVLPAMCNALRNLRRVEQFVRNNYLNGHPPPECRTRALFSTYGEQVRVHFNAHVFATRERAGDAPIADGVYDIDPHYNYAAVMHAAADHDLVYCRDCTLQCFRLDQETGQPIPMTGADVDAVADHSRFTVEFHVEALTHRMPGGNIGYSVKLVPERIILEETDVQAHTTRGLPVQGGPPPKRRHFEL